MTSRTPWDPGLQPERTGLAWLRTGLAFVAGATALIKLSGYRSGVLAVVLAMVATPLAAAILWQAWKRFRVLEQRLYARRPLPDGTLPLLLTMLATSLGLAGCVYVVLT